MSIWQLTNEKPGNVHRSIPTDVPVTWERKRSRFGDITYVSGEYEIERRAYARAGYSYQLTRQGVSLFGIYARLKDAKAHAVKNARGQERVSVA